MHPNKCINNTKRKIMKPSDVKISPRDLHILKLLTNGMRMVDIGKCLDLTYGTVKNVRYRHFGNVKFKQSTILGNKLTAYYESEYLNKSMCSYTVESLEGDEKGILHLINNGQIKVEPLS